MIQLNLDEKVVLKKSTSLLDGLKQKQGKIYITNERLIFEDTKNSSNNIYIQLSEIKSYRELKVFIKLNNGFEFHLDNGIKYCFILFGKSILSKLEEVRGSSIKKEIGVRHNWLPNILGGLLIGWFVVIPTISFVGSSVGDLITIVDNQFTKKITISEFNNHKFQLHQRKGGDLSFHKDRNFNYILSKLSDEFTFKYDTFSKTFNLEFSYDMDVKKSFSGKFTFNDGVIILDDDLFFYRRDYSMDLEEDVTRYLLISRKVIFNQDSTLTFLLKSTDLREYPVRENIDKSNNITRNYTYDHNSSSGMTDTEFKNLTKERLVNMNKWTEEMNGYYFILK